MRVFLAALVLAACGPTDRDNPAADAPSQGDAGPDVPVIDTSRVYAHSGKTLLQLNAATLAAMPLCTMNGHGTQSLTVLALDKDDRMLGITLDKLYEIDPSNGEATLISELDVNNATSLSFVPENLDDPASADILVTAN